MGGREVYYKIKILPKVETALGIYIETSSLDGLDVIRLSSKSGGVAEKSGMKDGDILIFSSLGNFAKSIFDNRGKSFQFEVERNGEEILIAIPEVPYFELR
jgi:hypothetical protein